MSFHRIVGTEAFDYANHRLGPAHGALRTFRAPRLRRSWLESWRLFAAVTALAILVIGHLI